jgi:acyl-coenzyme A thioesterase PaaI-like protein
LETNRGLTLTETNLNSALNTWARLTRWPFGKWLFTKVVCFRAPYFASIAPRFVELRAGHCVVTMRKRRAVTNHIGTVHAIAVCNLAELAAGTMTEATVPASHRWIPKGMTVEYLRKADSDLTGIATIDPIPVFGSAMDVPVRVSVTNASGVEVVRAVISMYVSPRRSAT